MYIRGTQHSLLFWDVELYHILQIHPLGRNPGIVELFEPVYEQFPYDQRKFVEDFSDINDNAL